jgi:ATP-binding cassette, subfamily B, bacterial
MDGSHQPPIPAGLYVGEPPGQPGAPPPGAEFRQVAFSYDVNQPRVLDGCSFSVPAGATTLVVGRSGAGKTALARLILGYWRNYQGQILVDGTDVKEWDGYALRKLMSYVAQQDHIVDETVKDNLAWAFPGPNEEEMLMAVHDVGLFSRHPGQNILQAQAKEFSGGEQQRLSVARMILDKSPIVLLDEPMAGVDAFTFHDLMPRIVDLFRDKSRTVLMVSHRLAFAAHADHIVVLGDGGVVTEQGPFDRLMADKGQFAKLYEAARQELIPDLYPKSS